MSYIGTKPADQVLDSTLIADGTILTADLANGAITRAKLDSNLQAVAVGRNRIINGAMVVAQRTTSAVTNDSGAALYPVDRFFVYGNVSSKFTAQQNAGSVTPPVGFTNYVGITSLSSYSVGASDANIGGQPIEGFNTADLQWGTANAKTVTLSFWVRSSLTGTFGGALQNNAQNRCYPFTYTISSANTWEYETITIAGDTAGTWLTNNGAGIRLVFGFGVGTTVSGTAGVWAGTQYSSATGAVSIVGTSGASWYMTGLQLEVGSSATGFEYRQYGTELALCQRYFQIHQQTDATGSNGNFAGFGWGSSWGGSSGFSVFYNPPLRAAPSVSFSAAFTFARHAPGINAEMCNTVSAQQASTQACVVLVTGNFSAGNGIGSILTPAASATATISSSSEL